MNDQQESRWSLNHTGNRLLLAVVLGLIVGGCANSAGLSTAAHLLVILAVAAVAHGLLTLIARR